MPQVQVRCERQMDRVRCCQHELGARFCLIMILEESGLDYALIMGFLSEGCFSRAI